MSQLTIDGREVSIAASRPPRFGPNQREVLRALGFGTLTSTQAGTLVHSRRGHCGFGARSIGTYNGSGCCAYAATDGSAVLRTLLERGIVEKAAGLWVLAPR